MLGVDRRQRAAIRQRCHDQGGVAGGHPHLFQRLAFDGGGIRREFRVADLPVAAFPAKQAGNTVRGCCRRIEQRQRFNAPLRAFEIGLIND